MNPRKQLKFLYRYLTTPYRWRKLTRPLVLLVVCAFVILLAAVLWTPSLSANQVDPTQTTVSTLAVRNTPLPTNTPLPAEFVSNSQQTIGITFAGAVLVLIVVIGVILFLPKKIDG